MILISLEGIHNTDAILCDILVETNTAVSYRPWKELIIANIVYLKELKIYHTFPDESAKYSDVRTPESLKHGIAPYFSEFSLKSSVFCWSICKTVQYLHSRRFCKKTV